jgi:hypothetical protein
MVMEKTTKEKIDDLKSLHQPAFDKLGLSNPLFIPRICYRPIGETEQVVSFFEQDFAKGEDIYTHFVSKGYDSEDPKNRLWKWTYNPFYATEYKRSEPHKDTGNIRFIVPADELELVDDAYITRKVGTTVAATIPFDLDKDLPDPDQDLPLDQMTIRDLAAILLKKPVSRKAWLNEIINPKSEKLPWE